MSFNVILSLLQISKLFAIFVMIKPKQLTMKRVLSALLVAVFALCISFEAKAWGTVAHHAAVYIAQQNITPTTKREIRNYLNHTLTYYATWMDHYRCTVPYEPLDWWHNVAVDEKNNIVELDGHSGYVQATRIIKEMQDYKSLPDSVVALNIKLLTHIIVDLHCPSHNRYLAPPFDWKKPQWAPGYSQGLKFKYKGKKVGYHGFWDNSPAYFHKGWTCEKFNEVFGNLTKKEAKKVCKGTLTEWVKQSVKDNRASFKYIVAGEDFAKIEKEHYDEMVALADQQLQYAGYRLAYVLNNIFDPAKSKKK